MTPGLQASRPQSWCHDEYRTIVRASPETLFAHLDDHTHLSAHMEKPSWRTLGGYMRMHADEASGRQVGSKLTLEGAVLGIKLFVEEQVTVREPPVQKRWQTIGTPKLLVIGPYEMGFSISPDPRGSSLLVSIDYSLCAQGMSRWLSVSFAGAYARWCTRQMVRTRSAISRACRFSRARKVRSHARVYRSSARASSR